MSCRWLGCRDYDPGLHVKSNWRAVRTENYMACFLKQNESEMQLVELFIMKKDPWQMNNLAQSPDNESLRQEMIQKLNDWITQTNDTLFASLKLVNHSR
jgi:uncharacterized sulfatase